jgi:hypothetical protein
MIATMAMNMPGPDENNRTTLVVVPAALLQQVYSFLHDRDDMHLLTYSVRVVERRTGI